MSGNSTNLWQTFGKTGFNAVLSATSIMQEKQPVVLQKSCHAFYISYEINAYTDQAQRMFKTYESKEL